VLSGHVVRCEELEEGHQPQVAKAHSPMQPIPGDHSTHHIPLQGVAKAWKIEMLKERQVAMKPLKEEKPILALQVERPETLKNRLLDDQPAQQPSPQQFLLVY
jgi:hypothetical protein